MRIALLTGITILVCCFCFKAKAQTDQTIANGAQTTPVNFPSGGCTYQWTNSNPSIGLPASGVGNIPAFTAINNGNGPVTATITATPISALFAYITNNSDGTVSVINIATNAVVSTIPVGRQPETVSISPDGKRIYITNIDDGTISVIDGTNNSVTATIPTGGQCAGVVLDPVNNFLYVTNYALNGNNVFVINTKTNTLVTTIPVGTYPWGIAISPDGTKVYVANNGSSSVSVINTATNTVVSSIQVGTGPFEINVTPDGSKIYVSNSADNNISVIDAASNTVTGTITVGTTPAGITFSPDGLTAYVTTLQNGISVINVSTSQVIRTISTATGIPYGVSTTPDGKFLYVTLLNAPQVAVINTADNTVVTVIDVGQQPISFGNFISNGSGCTSTPVTFKITVNSSQPTITPSAATGVILACAGTASADPNIQQFTVSGSNLTGDITATAPTGFDVSLTATGGYSSSLILKQTGGAVVNTTIYVRSSASDPVGPISGNVQIATPGATPATVAVTGTVNALPTINPVPNQTVNAGTSTTPINFTGTGNTFTWTNDKPGIGLPAGGSGNIAAFKAVNNSASPVTAKVTVTPVPLSYAYIANGSSNNVSVIDLATNSVVKTIPAGFSPLGVSVSPDGSRVYIANQGSNSITVINTTTNTVTATITEGQGAEPSGVAVSPDGTLLYVVNYNSYSAFSGVSVYNTATNALAANIPLNSFPFGIAVSHNGSRVYAVDASGVTTVINTATNTIITTIKTGIVANEVAVSPDDSKVYVTNPVDATVSVINTSTNMVVATIPVGLAPYGIALSPDGSRVYVANTNDNTISAINTATNTVISTIPTGVLPSGISVSADGSTICVVNSTSGSVTVINSSTYAIISTIPIGLGPESPGNFIAGGGCAGTPATFTITVNSAPPSITAGSVSGTITACEGTASASPNIQQFTVSGSNLTDNITATAPEGFEVSLAPGSGYGNNVIIPQSAGAINNVTIYVRSSASDGGSISGIAISGSVTLITAGAVDKTVSVSGTVYAAPTVNPVSNQTVIAGQATTSVNFTGTAGSFMWTNDTPGIGLPANGTGSIPSFTPVNPGPNPVVATLTVMPQSMSAVACAGTPVTFTITVNPLVPPSITAPDKLFPLSTIYGTPSVSDSFLLAATSLQSPITITPPPGFEVSGDNSYYSSTLAVGGIGNLGATPIYVRLAGTTPVGIYSGNIVLSSAGANDVNVAIPNSIVHPAPLTITADNKTKPFNTPNPPLTVTYTGFQNQDGPGQLTTQPIITTTATTSSPIGDYPITISGAVSPNYDISYIAGTLTIVPSPSSVRIPNAFTPNGDGVNDVWNIPDLNSYPQCKVSVYSRNGSLVYQSHGYPVPWDGTVNGSPVPWGTYYYIIDLHADVQLLSGYVAVLR